MKDKTLHEQHSIDSQNEKVNNPANNPPHSSPTTMGNANSSIKTDRPPSMIVVAPRKGTRKTSVEGISKDHAARDSSNSVVLADKYNYRDSVTIDSQSSSSSEESKKNEDYKMPTYYVPGDSPLVIHTKKGQVPKNAPAALQLVREWIHCKDHHDIQGMMELTDMEHCVLTFVDSEAEMPAREFYGAMHDTFASFPNLHFFWSTMKMVSEDNHEAGDDKEDIVKVVIEDYYGIGTHTGTPYSFGPYPPMEPRGTAVRDENIRFTFWVQTTKSKDGTKLKIVKATVDAFGKIVGPPGFYTKIGGLIM